jgi:hypothetical protein
MGTALVMVASLLVAVVPAKPASAAPVAFTPVWNGGDLTLSETLPYSADDLTWFTAEIMAPGLGLPTTASTTQVAQALMTTFQQRGELPSSITGVPQPTGDPTDVIAATTVTATESPTSTPGANVTETTPASTIQNLKIGFSGAVTWVAAMFGLYLGMGLCGLFTARGIRNTPLLPGESYFQLFARVRPGGWGWTVACGLFLANMIELPVNNLWLGQKLNYPLIISSVVFALLQFVNGKWWFNRFGGWIATWAGSLFISAARVGLDLEQGIGMQVLDPAVRTAATAQYVADLTERLFEGSPIPPDQVPQFIPGHFPEWANAVSGVIGAQLEVEIVQGLNDAIAQAGLPAAAAMGTGGTVRNPLRIDGNITCMDAYDQTSPLIPGGIVALNVCNGNPNQFFKGYNTQNCTESHWANCVGVPFQITNDGLCLAPVNETVNTSQDLTLSWCDGSDAQLWYESWGDLRNVASGLCVDVHSGHSTFYVPHAGDLLDEDGCGGSYGESWYGFQVPDRTPVNDGTITSGYTGGSSSCHVLAHISFAYPPSQGTPVVYASCDGSANQNWVTWSDNTVTGWGQCLDLAGGATAPGTGVVLNDCNGSDNQKWIQWGNVLHNKGSGLCLEVFFDANDNATMGINTCGAPRNGSYLAQKWLLPGNSGSNDPGFIPNSGLQMAVASYIYPTDAAWNRLIAASSTKESVLVANVLNGPGSEQVAAWKSVIDQAHASGKKVLGYVDTGYFGMADSRRTRLGSLAPADWFMQIEADVNSWYSLYGGSIDGIFFDDGFNTCGANNEYANWYRELSDYAKLNHGAMTVVNPGTVVPQCYDGTADVLLTYESDANTYVNAYIPLGWTPAKSQLWHIVYGASADQLQNVVNLANTRGAGYLEVTDGVLPNPYNTLPSDAYWTQELNAVQGGYPDVAPATVYAGTGGTPATPGLTLSSNDYSSATLTWPAVAGASQYLIDGNGQYGLIVPGSMTSATIGGLTPGGQTYTFTVRAQGADGSLSAPSNAVTATTLALPNGPRWDGGVYPATIGNVTVSASANSTTYTADFFVPYAFHRVYIWTADPSLLPPCSGPDWPVNYTPSDYVCTTYMIEGNTLFQYSGPAANPEPWSWTPVGTVQVNVSGYTTTWTVPLGTATAPTDHFLIQGQGYGPLTNIFGPCPQLGIPVCKGQ